tara:strand:- start:4 stop:207 length:204 start_codon:yes stop_codon:yes gene_type:complete
MTTIQTIQNNTIYKQILSDSFGGVMYDVSNRTKYESKELLKLWDSLPGNIKESSGGIMKGVFNFLNS